MGQRSAEKRAVLGGVGATSCGGEGINVGMEVALDLRALDPTYKAHFGRGTGRYAMELQRAFAEASTELAEAGVRIRELHSGALSPSGAADIMMRSLPYGKMTVRNHLFLSSRLRSLGSDLVHFVSHTDAPSFGLSNSLVTVLDLIPLKFEQLYGAEQRNLRFRFARYLENRAIRSARGIVAISECTRRDIVELLGVQENSIHVTPLGVSSDFQPLAGSCAECQEQRFKLRKKYDIAEQRAVILYIGGIDPRKNVEFLVETVADLGSIDRLADSYTLVLAGNMEGDAGFPALKSRIESLLPPSQVKLLGRVSDASLYELYHLSDVFFFPSIYEGFGLPLLEAMASGALILAGDNSALPEVVPDRRWLLPDGARALWVERVAELLLLDDGAKEARRREGIAWASQFTWRRTMLATLEAYRDFSRAFRYE